MISIDKQADNQSSLERHHRILCSNSKADWTEAWELFCNDEWFQRRLSSMAISVSAKVGLPRATAADIRQEAQVIFAQVLKRDITLGFDQARGNLGALLSTIAYRCCLKATRQFRAMRNTQSHREDQHSLYEPWDGVDEHLDFQLAAKRLREPWLTTVKLFLAGQSVSEIAESVNRSERTVYRRLDEAIHQLRKHMQAT